MMIMDDILMMIMDDILMMIMDDIFINIILIYSSYLTPHYNIILIYIQANLTHTII